jgi:hypothetical protein
MALRLGIGLGLLPASVSVVPTTAPVNTVAPSITGIATQGQTGTCLPGSWSGVPSGSYAYQWKRNGTNIAGQTASTHIYVLADVDQAITCSVVATNSIGASSPAPSNTVTPVATLTISGSAPGGTVGSAYSFTPTSTGGRATKTYALTGSLPAGLSFSTATGAVSGTPTASGTASGLDITVTDGDGLTASLGAFSIVISAGSGSGDLDFTDPAGTEVGIATGVI